MVLPIGDCRHEACNNGEGVEVCACHFIQRLVIAGLALFKLESDTKNDWHLISEQAAKKPAGFFLGIRRM